MEGISEKIQITVLQEGYSSFAKNVKACSHGGKVLLFAEEDRCGEDAQAALAFEGLQIVKRDLSRRIEEENPLHQNNLPEGIMAIVGVGGVRAMEAAKARPLGGQMERILFPTDFSALSALDERCFVGLKKDILRLRSEGHVVLFDSKILSKSSEIKAGLGFLLARYVEEIDAIYERLLLSGENPAAALRTVKEHANTLRNLREEAPAESLSEVGFTLLKDSPCEISDSAHLLAFLAAREKGENYAEYLFPASYALIRLYAAYLGDLPLEHCPPPDRARNADLLEKRCDISASVTLGRGKAYVDDYDKRAHDTAEYREDFLDCLSESVLPLSLLSRIYRRAPISGENRKMLTAKELLALLSLTGEAVSGYPLLKHIKMTGVLEPLLDCA